MSTSAKRTGEQALDRIYNLSMDNIALSEQRRYIQELVTYGTVFVLATVDYTPCNCIGCRRVRIDHSKKIKTRVKLVLASLFALACLVFRIWWDGGR